MSSTYLFGENSIFAKIDRFTSLGMDVKLDKALGFERPVTQGPRLSDLTVQSSTMGAPLARVYGTVALTGNVIWLEGNKLKETVRKKKSGGKGGGGGSSVKTYSYFATFAVSLCEGPIAGVRRIWVGPDLIYNAGSDDLETIIASNKAGSWEDALKTIQAVASGRSVNDVKFKIYPGTDDQSVDPRIEADMGVGQTPAFRGTAYIVFYDLPLAKYGNSLMGAQVKVEVMKSTSLHARPLKVERFPTPGVGESGNGVFQGLMFPEATAYVLHPMPSGTDSGILTEVNASGRRRVSTVAPIGSWQGKRRIYGLSDRSRWMITHTGASTSSRPLHTDRGSIDLPPGAPEMVLDIADTGMFVYYQNNDPVGPWRISSIDTEGLAWSVIETMQPSFSGFAMAAGGGHLYLFNKPSSGSLRVRRYTPALEFVDEFDAPFPSAYSISIATASCVVGDQLFIVANSSASSGAGSELIICQIDLSAGSNIAQYAVVIDAPSGSSGAYSTLGYSDGIFIYGQRDGVGEGRQISLYYFRLGAPDFEAIPLSTVVQSELLHSRLIELADVDVSDISSDQVRGYRLPGVQQIRGAIEPLQTAWPFDLISSGYQVKAVRRGRASSQTIPLEQLDARQYGDEPGVQIDLAREMDAQLPRKVSIKHLDGDRDYDVNEQYSPERLSSQAVNIVEYDLPIVLTPDEAARMSEVLFNVPWIERDALSFRLPPSFATLEPADVVTIDAGYAQFPVRLTEVNYRSDGIIDVVARPSAPASYISIAVGGEGIIPGGEVPLAGQSEYVLLDIPLIRNDENQPGFAAAMAGTTNSWPGGVLYRSTDNGQTWTDVQAWEAPVTMGDARNSIGVHDGRVIDRTSQLRVDVTGELESVTEAQMMTGQNWLAYGADGRWELLRFADAALQSDGSYILTTLLRGLRGTEWATVLHQPGDNVVLLDDPDNAFIGADLSALNVVRQWRGVSAGQSVDEVDSINFAYRGVNLKPLSPVHGAATLAGSDWVLTWDPRTRIQGSLWKTGLALPIGEAAERYETDIMDGSTVVRTLTSTTPTATYTEAMQLEDFGSPQSTITARVYQLSATVGRGYPHEITA